jgi:hypothetical protein
MARVEEMLRILQQREVIGEGTIPPDGKSMRYMVEAFDELKLKPRKGRLKDLKRIQRFLDDLATRFPTQP